MKLEEKILFVLILIFSTQLSRFIGYGIFNLGNIKSSNSLWFTKNLEIIIFGGLVIYSYWGYSDNYEYTIRIIAGVVAFMLQCSFRHLLMSSFISTAFYCFGINYYL